MKHISHNGLVAGSSPAGPTNDFNHLAPDLRRGRKFIEPNGPKSAVHFVGFRGDEWWSAVKVWGMPDFVHPGWDMRARREIAEGDVLIFATGSDADEPRQRNWSDYIEVEDDEGR